MSDRILIGAGAAVTAILTLVQLLWMFGMFSPARAVAGQDGAFPAILIAAWFWLSFAVLVAAAVILLMARNEAPRRR